MPTIDVVRRAPKADAAAAEQDLQLVYERLARGKITKAQADEQLRKVWGGAYRESIAQRLAEALTQCLTGRRRADR